MLMPPDFEPRGLCCPPWDAEPPIEAYEPWVPPERDAAPQAFGTGLATKRADLTSLLAHAPPGRAWFIGERIERGRGALLTGLGGSSKTRALYYLALGAVLGRLPWGWNVRSTGAAVLLLTEDTERDLHETLDPVLRSLDASDTERRIVERQLHVFPLAGHEFRLLDSADGRHLIRTGHYAELVDLIRGYGNVAFVGLDPALGLTAGDELDQGHQRLLGKAIDDLAVNTGAAVVLTAHATKSSLGQDELLSHASRGGGAITDAVRGEFAMRTMTKSEATKAGIQDIEERKRHVQLVATKGNHVPPAAFVPVWLRRGEHGVLEAADIDCDHTSNCQPGQRERDALRVLVEMQKTATPRLVEWRAECVARGVIRAKSAEAQDKAMRRVVNQLKSVGLIERGMCKGTWVPTELGAAEVGR